MIAHSIIISAITGVALLGNPATALTVPGSAKTLQARATSTISVEEICGENYGPERYYAKTTGNGCNDWVCAPREGISGKQYGIDMNGWCADWWGPGAYASCKNGVYSWVCNY